VSYDVEVWSVERPALPDVLPAGARWAPNGDGWSAGARHWQVVIGPISELEPEDIPDDLHPTLPGLRYLTELNLEPIGAPAAGRSLLDRTARAIARRAHGVVVDRQADTIALPSGVRRYRGARAEGLDLLSLSWWFLTDPIERDLLERFVDVIERWLA
jgi:hypothetical protein